MPKAIGMRDLYGATVLGIVPNLMLRSAGNRRDSIGKLYAAKLVLSCKGNKVSLFLCKRDASSAIRSVCSCASFEET
jgi:hypothetical protein